MFELVFLTGARAGQVVPVTKNLLAGRSPECSLEVPDPNASRQHSRFVFDGTSVTVVDNNSSNGTYVNDLRLTGPVKLQHDDVVRLGETRLRFRASDRSRSHTASSIFGFNDNEEDLSQSILLSLTDIPRRTQSPEVLAARLNAIVKVSKTLVSISKLDAVFEGILDALFEIFPQADRAFLMIGHRADQLEGKAMRQRSSGGKGLLENLNVSKTICRQALESRGAILFDDSKAPGFDQGQSIVSMRIRSAMVVPLMVEEEILGLIQVDTPDRGRAFTQDDLELAIAVGQQAAIALKSAYLLRRVEEDAKRRDNLMRFLPGPMVEQALSGELDIQLGGRTCRSTVMFADIRGFTRMSETMDPEQVVRLMNGCFSRMVPCIEDLGGGVDKFMGDAVMAVWGVPIDKGQSAQRAAQAALAMHNALVGFNSLQTRENRIRLEMGIGINTGTVVAGNIGSDNRVSYIVIGDTVNTAQRLESNAGRGQVLASGGTWSELSGNAFGLLMPPLKVKNRSEPVVTYSLRGVRIHGQEVLLHLAGRSQETPVWLIRRLADYSFLVLHPVDHDICAAPLVTAVAEWPGIDLGTPIMESVLPCQLSDGLYIRSQVRLPDPTLKGLLDSVPLTCGLEWEAMR